MIQRTTCYHGVDLIFMRLVCALLLITPISGVAAEAPYVKDEGQGPAEHNPYLKAKSGETQKSQAKSAVKAALALIKPTKGNQAEGKVRLIEKKSGIELVGEVTGLSPGKHGFHIHEYGDCSAEDATSAGGHFAPDDSKHGSPREKVHHSGDLGNIVADKNGRARISLRDPQISFSGKNSVLGRAIIIHEKEDSFTQPAGNAGARLACGVIGVDKTGRG